MKSYVKSSIMCEINYAPHFARLKWRVSRHVTHSVSCHVTHSVSLNVASNVTVAVWWCEKQKLDNGTRLLSYFNSGGNERISICMEEDAENRTGRRQKD